MFNAWNSWLAPSPHPLSRRVKCSFCNLVSGKRRWDRKTGGSPPLRRNSVHYRAARRHTTTNTTATTTDRKGLEDEHDKPLGCDLNIRVWWGLICSCSGGGSCVAGTFNWWRWVSIKSPQCSAPQLSARSGSVGGASGSKHFSVHKAGTWLFFFFFLMDAC